MLTTALEKIRRRRKKKKEKKKKKKKKKKKGTSDLLIVLRQLYVSMLAKRLPAGPSKDKGHVVHEHFCANQHAERLQTD